LAFDNQNVVNKKYLEKFEHTGLCCTVPRARVAMSGNSRTLTSAVPGLALQTLASKFSGKSSWFRQVLTPCRPPQASQDQPPHGKWKMDWVGTLVYRERLLPKDQPLHSDQMEDPGF